LKKLLAKYSAWILKVLAPLGPWGVVAFAALDSAAYGLPLDPLMAGYVYRTPSLFLVYPVMGAVGSALGSLVLYLIGLKGGEVVLEKRVSQERIERIRNRFEQQEFLALMIPSMLPPPTPFKLFVLSAGAFRMRMRSFVLAIFSGRLLRFLFIAIVTRYFGPQIVQALGEAFRQHLWVSLTVLTLILIAVVYFFLRKPAEKIAEVAKRS
jgi:membrane protein YqaA with SNARE-associated domain